MTSESDRIREEYERRAATVPAQRYDPTSPGQLFMRQRRERAVLEALRNSGSLPLRSRRILEVGCGSGQWLADLETWGASKDKLAGIDLIDARVDEARHRLGGRPPDDVDLRSGDASALPWADESFDLVLQSMMFSSIHDPAMATRVAAEMDRVLAGGGLILWHDFCVGNPRNRRVRGIRRSELAGLFPGYEIRAKRISLAFPLARRLAHRYWLLADVLEGLRFANIQTLATLQKPRSHRP